MSAKAVVRFLLCGAVVLGWSGRLARAGSVASDLNNDFQNAAAGAGTWTGFAYSERLTLNGAAAPAGPNQSTSWYTSPIATGGKTLKDPLPLATTPAGQNVAIVFRDGTGAIVPPSPYGPTVSAGRAKNLLVAPLESESVSSSSGGVGTSVHSIASYKLTSPTFPGTPSISSYSYTDHNTVGGKASSIAYDPFQLNPATYQYGGQYNHINFSIAPESAQGAGDVKFEAFDSRFVGNPTLTGDNIIYGNSLWALNVHENGPALADKSNLSVSFTLNSAAVAAGAFSNGGSSTVAAAAVAAGGSSNAVVTGPITAANVDAFDAMIASGVMNAISVNNGVASLSDYQLFPSTFDYIVSGSSVTYANDTATGLYEVSAVPEPSSLVLLGLGSVVVAVRSRRRREPTPVSLPRGKVGAR